LTTIAELFCYQLLTFRTK